MHRIELEGGEPCEIAGVQTELYSAMSNLVTNAVRHISDKGLIRITWDLLADGQKELKAKDSGSVIFPEHL